MRLENEEISRQLANALLELEKERRQQREENKEEAEKLLEIEKFEKEMGTKLGLIILSI